MPAAFTLVEILAVISIVAIIAGVSTMSLLNLRRSPGTRQGALLQLSSMMEEARMSAIEQRTTLYVGFAGADHPDPEKRMRSYILFRKLTAEELAAMPPPVPADTYRALSEWYSLPKGFYWDGDSTSSLFKASDTELATNGLAGPSAKLRILAFGPLGAVEIPASPPVQLAVAAGDFDEQHGNLLKSEADSASAFVLQINRLTGRVNTIDPPAPASAPPP